MKKIKDLLNQFLLEWFNVEYEIDSKPYRRVIYTYWFIIKESLAVLMTIDSVKIMQTRTGIDCHITTHRPGLIIGKGGRDFNALTEYFINEELPVTIKLHESKLWTTLNN